MINQYIYTPTSRWHSDDALQGWDAHVYWLLLRYENNRTVAKSTKQRNSEQYHHISQEDNTTQRETQNVFQLHSHSHNKPSVFCINTISWFICVIEKWQLMNLGSNWGRHTRFLQDTNTQTTVIFAPTLERRYKKKVDSRGQWSLLPTTVRSISFQNYAFNNHWFNPFKHYRHNISLIFLNNFDKETMLCHLQLCDFFYRLLN